MTPPEIHGRFLPSRVFSRWKWTVRFGLLIVPLLVFLSGGLVLFLSPNVYRSSCLFSHQNGPPPGEIVELLKSDKVLGIVVNNLELTEKLDLDSQNCTDILRESIKIRLVPDTRLLEISTDFRNKQLARDITGETPTALDQHLSQAAQEQFVFQIAEMKNILNDARDTAEEQAVALNRLLTTHAESLDEPVVATATERARRATLLADAEVERIQALIRTSKAERPGRLPHLTVHSDSKISEAPVDPRVGPDLNQLVVRSLIAGLLASLLLPYLLELAFPPRFSRPKTRPEPPEPADIL